MAEEPASAFPLFPLGLVALPGEAVPLHIFEDRYRRMIARCLEGEEGSQARCFGIVWLSDEELKEVGCEVEVERVLERMPDGRMNIVVRGRRPFRLLRRRDDEPWPAGDVEFLQDDAGEDDEDAAKGARALYGELVQQATDRELSDEELSEMDAYQMAGTVEFAAEDKQELLELRSEAARMRLLSDLLRTALERLELLERAQARALSNGKVRFG